VAAWPLNTVMGYPFGNSINPPKTLEPFWVKMVWEIWESIGFTSPLGLPRGVAAAAVDKNLSRRFISRLESVCARKMEIGRELGWPIPLKLVLNFL
jgi:hypothetical protein